MIDTDENTLAAVLAAVDRVNAEDPVSETVNRVERPRALVYGERMSARLADYRPDAGVALRIAARAQHVRRWAVPRGDYPAGRAGYHRWRRDLGRYHARLAGELMRECGYGEAMVDRVGELLRKERLATDPEAQALEDVACLVFLEHYLEDFVRRHEGEHGRERIVAILRRTWGKMTPQGHAAARRLALPVACKGLLAEALSQG